MTTQQHGPPPPVRTTGIEARTEHDDIRALGSCQDPQVDEISALVAAGVPQREASLAVYANAEQIVWRATTLSGVHAYAHRLMPWLGCCAEVAV